jgi:AraC-like ligand binding domain
MEPPGDDGLCSVPLGTIKISPACRVTVRSLPPSRRAMSIWPSRARIREVFHAHLVDYAYPPHCHETWAVLIVDDGAIRYDLDRRRCGAAGQTVTILPPGVAHDGRPAPGARGFRKRELYLDGSFFPAEPPRARWTGASRTWFVALPASSA